MHNKKLFADVNNLENILEHRDREVSNLKRQLEEQMNANSRLQSENNLLEKNVRNNIIIT